MSVTHPDVPQTEGVPAVFRDGTNPGDGPGDAPLSADGELVVRGPKGWGIYDQNGNSALDADSVFALEPSREFRISDYPLEGGGFQSYNKVATPYEARVTVTKGGTSSERQAFLRQIDALLETTDLYSIVTPDKVFLNVNIVRYSYRRSAESGAGLLVIELFGEEVREDAEGAYTSTKEPSGANAVNGGPVRPQTPTDAQTPAGVPQ